MTFCEQVVNWPVFKLLGYDEQVQNNYAKFNSLLFYI